MAKHYQSNQKLNHQFSIIRRVILTIIILATVVVIISVVCVFIFNPEHQTKSKIESLAKNYYENFTYQNILNADNYSGNPATALQKYQDKGLPTVTLRQLLLNDSRITPQDYEYITNYCNEETTYVKFYPEQPFSRADYHVEYTYSCNF